MMKINGDCGDYVHKDDDDYGLLLMAIRNLMMMMMYDGYSDGDWTGLYISYQRYAPQIHMPAHELIPVTPAWPFYKWAINLIVNFVWEEIVCCFGVPHEIVSDNSKQFVHDSFRSWCDGLNIKQTFSSVAHPQANEQVEVTNRDIVVGIKVRLDTDIKAVIPAEIAVPTQRMIEFNDESNVINLKENLNLLEERRDIAAIREVSNKQKNAKYYNQRVRERTFCPDNYVWRNNNASRVKDTDKLGPNWEGPYVIAEALGNGAYNLKTHDGKFVPCTWHATNLKKFYV
ncbi:uncharacterized protein [Rutidosis leptorrhynchoides]|uniref:uncharacterized protein n=1 Tax=Rutidosis leptorrhynchoides TaxID=125765 RepID=UPI003A996399